MAREGHDAVSDRGEIVSCGIDDDVIELGIINVAIIEISHPATLVRVVPPDELLDGSVGGFETVSTTALGRDIRDESANALGECGDDTHTENVRNRSQQPLPSPTEHDDV